MDLMDFFATMFLPMKYDYKTVSNFLPQSTTWAITDVDSSALF